MAGIEDTTAVDLIGHDPTAGEYVLYMVETRPWGDNPLQGAWLREKINAYAGFILDGTLVDQYPETADASLRIQLDCPETPTGEFAAIVERATQQLDALGIRFVVNARGF
jgi:hypothetical protein